MEENGRPVVIDCDPGNDDALAIIMMAASPQVRIVGITTVAGNVAAETTASNALALASFLGIEAPVTAGAYPLMRPYMPLDTAIMGQRGMGAVRLPQPDIELDPRTSAQLLFDLCCAYPEGLEVLATGPLTNLALLFAEHPDSRDHISRIILMGGSVNGGNTSPVAEFNIHTDAEAARVVFRSGVPITMVGLDVCYQNRLLPEDFDELERIGGEFGQLVGRLFFYPGTPEKPFPAIGKPVSDSIAAAALLDPTCVSSVPLHVDVETVGELTYGETVVDVKDRLKLPPNADVVESCDKNRYLALVRHAVRHFA